MCAKYYKLRYMFYKKCTSSKLALLLDTVSKFALFLVSGLKDEKLIKKQTYTKTETCKPYSRVSRVFWTFLPNFVKIDPYNFELYRFKVCAFFWDTLTQCICHINKCHDYCKIHLSVNFWALNEIPAEIISSRIYHGSFTLILNSQHILHKVSTLMTYGNQYHKILRPHGLTCLDSNMT